MKKKTGTIIRNPSADDAEDVLALLTAWDIADFGSPDSTLDDLQDQWSDIALDQDAWLMIDPESGVKGYAAVFKGEQRFTIDLCIHPDMIDDGSRDTLLDLCERRIQEQLQQDPAAPANATIFVSRNNPADRQAVERHGFQAVRHHLRMQIEMDAPPETTPMPQGMRMRNFIPGEDDHAVHALIQAAFERPGRTPQSFASWRDFMIGAYNFERELWFLLFAGEELTGAILCFDYPQYGWVRQLAVDDRWRGRGIGSFLLRHAFRVFYERGKNTVGLGVDAENDRAFQIYEHAGMRRSRAFAEYNKPMTR